MFFTDKTANQVRSFHIVGTQLIFSQIAQTEDVATYGAAWKERRTVGKKKKGRKSQGEREGAGK